VSQRDTLDRLAVEVATSDRARVGSVGVSGTVKGQTRSGLANRSTSSGGSISMLDEAPVRRLQALKPRSVWRLHQVYRS
jgi:hypothetical protein